MKAVLIAGLLLALPAAAQDAGHAGHAAKADAAADARVAPDKRAAERQMAAINARMHTAMAVPLTGDLDADFVRSMIPHHQGAIDMAQLTLTQSTDPTIRTLARGIIGAQRREIAAMRAWLRSKGVAER